MATLNEHCRDCERELGEPFTHVHEWLDELQPDYGPMHRVFRHHREGVERVRAKWGDRAARAAEIHIRRDTGGVIPSQAALRNRWGITAEDIVAASD
ncbi:MAG: hypothetical protein K9N51_00800 [Candidatus Pacebacteria bacterium]|nr:hypothetical protein [Candidatus Paceibacterota bacterium]